MNNKVLINLNMPEVEVSFDVFIPVNEIIWRIKKMLVKSIMDITNINIVGDDYLLINKDNGHIYNNNSLVIDTDIRNTSELYLLSKV